jgi:predicted DNA-binding transcriptional regulator AlpA
MQAATNEADLADAVRELLARLERTRDDGLWDADDIAAYMRLSKKSVQNHYLEKPGFPKAVILATGGRRWVSAEVKAWILRRRG